jgi:4-amino-4-deoxy-L-arabinose transferase-like glycosyltransferase
MVTRGHGDAGNAARPGLSPLLLCLFALSVRLGPLWVNRFHPDEALFSSWALAIAFGRDRLLTAAAPDKPPLLFYLMAVAFLVLGHVEVAGRLIGLMAGVISVPLMWQLARRLETPPSVAALAMALSPLAILFSPTAFLDPLMVMLVLASLVAATHRRYGWSGVWLGLAAATKVQALVFLPLVVAILYCQNIKIPYSARILRLGAGVVIPLLGVLIWDHNRGGTPFWIQQTINYGGIRLIYPGQVIPRLIGWASILPYFFGWPLLIVLALGLPVLLIVDLIRHARTRSATLDLILIAFALGFAFFHWLLAFPIWDRYLFALVPVMCLLVGRLASRIRAPQARLVTALIVIALMSYPAAQAFQSALPVGGDHGSQDSIDRITDYLRGYPYGTVVYDHWLGWSLRYYLWDATPYIAYFDTPDWLAQDLHVFGRTSARFVIIPSGESTTRIERAIVAQGFALAPIMSTQNRRSEPTFTLYRIDSYATQ